MNKIVIILILAILLLNITNAEESFIFKQGELSTLEISMSNNNLSQCTECSCEISIFYPNGSSFIRNTPGSNVGGYCSYNFTANTPGKYGVEMLANNSIDYGRATFEIEVNYIGKTLSESQATLYLGLLAILIFTLFVTFFGMGFLPKGNNSDEQGRIVSINHLKHLRLVGWLFAYFLFIAIIYLCSNLAFAFLQEQLFAKLLFAIFTILFSLSPLVIILILISFFVKFFHDKEFQRLINRGMFPGDRI